MTLLGPALGSALEAATRALAAVPCDPATLRRASDDELRELIATVAEHRRLVDAHAAILAGELARRSAPELGHDGLAQRFGHRTPEKMLQFLTGSTARDAVQAVRVGSLAETHPWLTIVTAALGAGEISADHAEAIRSGLGRPSECVPASVLADAAERLVLESTSLDADAAFRRARSLRDDLDLADVGDRARADHEAREFRLVVLRDGRVRISWLLDAVEGSVVKSVYDRATSPKRGGPRFVTEEQKVHAIADDARSVEQLASDAFLHLVTAGAEVDPRHLLGRGAPAVRVTVTERELTTRTGRGRLDGRAIPIDTIERLACTQGTVIVVTDQHGQPLDVGREQRLFTARQRLALEVRDGGCRWPGCERPPSWCEAHHIEHWAVDHGRTEVSNGILLCKHHHLLLHDHRWRIERRGAAGEEHWLIPPDAHPVGAPRLMARSTAIDDLLTG